MELRRERRKWLGYLLPVGTFALLAAALWFGMGDLKARNDIEGVRVTEQAVRRAAVQCYAIEGEYPPSLVYLKENYGVETGDYSVHYTVIASNLMPDITVFAKDSTQE